MKHSLTTYKHIFKQIPQLNTKKRSNSLQVYKPQIYIHIPQLNTHAKQKLYIFVLYAFLAIKNTISQNIFTN